ncbi:hypothetical protein LY76DRAFT_248168 [Colletotrichum caudatum]|nr:hypothetical protein LY76DRAFT_248168 [Colletotrichum caudatum]
MMSTVRRGNQWLARISAVREKGSAYRRGASRVHCLQFYFIGFLFVLFPTPLSRMLRNMETRTIVFRLDASVLSHNSPGIQKSRTAPKVLAPIHLTCTEPLACGFDAVGWLVELVVVVVVGLPTGAVELPKGAVGFLTVGLTLLSVSFRFRNNAHVRQADGRSCCAPLIPLPNWWTAKPPPACSQP